RHVRRVLQPHLQRRALVRSSLLVGHGALPDVRAGRRAGVGGLRDGQPGFRASAGRGGRPVPRAAGLPDPGLPARAGASTASRASTDGADRALLAHGDGRADLPADPAREDPGRGAPRHARRRRPGLPLADVGGELPDVRAVPLRRQGRPGPLEDRDRRAGGAGAHPPDLRRRRTDAGGGRLPAGPRTAPRAEPLARERAPDPPRRPARADQEHPAGVPGLRAVPPAQSVLDRTGEVPGAALPLEDGARRVRAVRRALRQPRLRRHEPRRDGGTAAEPAPGGPCALAQCGCVLAPWTLRDRGEPVRPSRDGRRAGPGAGDAAGGAGPEGARAVPPRALESSGPLGAGAAGGPGAGPVAAARPARGAGRAARLRRRRVPSRWVSARDGAAVAGSDKPSRGHQTSRRSSSTSPGGPSTVRSAARTSSAGVSGPRTATLTVSAPLSAARSSAPKASRSATSSPANNAAERSCSTSRRSTTPPLRGRPAGTSSTTIFPSTISRPATAAMGRSAETSADLALPGFGARR